MRCWFLFAFAFCLLASSVTDAISVRSALRNRVRSQELHVTGINAKSLYDMYANSKGVAKHLCAYDFLTEDLSKMVKHNLQLATDKHAHNDYIQLMDFLKTDVHVYGLVTVSALHDSLSCTVQKICHGRETLSSCSDAVCHETKTTPVFTTLVCHKDEACAMKASEHCRTSLVQYLYHTHGLLNTRLQYQTMVKGKRDNNFHGFSPAATAAWEPSVPIPDPFLASRLKYKMDTARGFYKGFREWYKLVRANPEQNALLPPLSEFSQAETIALATARQRRAVNAEIRTIAHALADYHRRHPAPHHVATPSHGHPQLVHGQDHMSRVRTPSSASAPPPREHTFRLLLELGAQAQIQAKEIVPSNAEVALLQTHGPKGIADFVLEKLTLRLLPEEVASVIRRAFDESRGAMEKTASEFHELLSGDMAVRRQGWQIYMGSAMDDLIRAVANDLRTHDLDAVLRQYLLDPTAAHAAPLREAFAHLFAHQRRSGAVDKSSHAAAAPAAPAVSDMAVKSVNELDMRLAELPQPLQQFLRHLSTVDTEAILKSDKAALVHLLSSSVSVRKVAINTFLSHYFKEFARQAKASLGITIDPALLLQMASGKLDLKELQAAVADLNNLVKSVWHISPEDLDTLVSQFVPQLVRDILRTFAPSLDFVKLLTQHHELIPQLLSQDASVRRKAMAEMITLVATAAADTIRKETGLVLDPKDLVLAINGDVKAIARLSSALMDSQVVQRLVLEAMTPALRMLIGDIITKLPFEEILASSADLVAKLGSKDPQLRDEGVKNLMLLVLRKTAEYLASELGVEVTYDDLQKCAQGDDEAILRVTIALGSTPLGQEILSLITTPLLDALGDVAGDLVGGAVADVVSSGVPVFTIYRGVKNIGNAVSDPQYRSGGERAAAVATATATSGSFWTMVAGGVLTALSPLTFGATAVPGIAMLAAGGTGTAVTVGISAAEQITEAVAYDTRYGHIETKEQMKELAATLLTRYTSKDGKVDFSTEFEHGRPRDWPTPEFDIRPLIQREMDSVLSDMVKIQLVISKGEKLDQPTVAAQVRLETLKLAMARLKELLAAETARLEGGHRFVEVMAKTPHRIAGIVPFEEQGLGIANILQPVVISLSPHSKIDIASFLRTRNMKNPVNQQLSLHLGMVFTLTTFNPITQRVGNKLSSPRDLAHLLHPFAGAVTLDAFHELPFHMPGIGVHLRSLGGVGDDLEYPESLGGQRNKLSPQKPLPRQDEFDDEKPGARGQSPHRAFDSPLRAVAVKA